jgi:hypothetical protein
MTWISALQENKNTAVGDEYQSANEFFRAKKYTFFQGLYTDSKSDRKKRTTWMIRVAWVVVAVQRIGRTRELHSHFTATLLLFLDSTKINL